MVAPDATQRIAQDFRRFARTEARGKSPLYERLAQAVADDPALLRFLSGRPEPKRQPNLLFAAVRHLFGTQPDFASFRAAVLDNRAAVADLVERRRTQTNEPGRCAVLLPVLAALPQPLALLEVGAAAGLCLLPDSYAYRFGERPVGSAGVVFPCAPFGAVPVPRRVPEVVWRAGIDLDPVDLHSEDDVRWLEALVWPEETDRLARLRAAMDIARRDPPRVVRANLLEAMPELAAEAPRDATLVVFHTAVLGYLEPADRERFRNEVRVARATWIANESPAALPFAVPDLAATSDGAAHFLVAQDERPVAVCDPHGRWIRWLEA